MSTPTPIRKPIPVVDPDGRWHPSHAAAALATGLPVGLIGAKARLGEDGWSLADPDELEVALDPGELETKA